ncbi:MAG: carboxymuconolactone decarboxylase family protein [Bacteroidales bacterium]|nr:carboxymuconolactone decarboxylase family protein [Bacteroidales bacterium]
MSKKIKEFNQYRAKMNKRILLSDNKVIKRIFSIDTLAYQDGALDRKTKEMLGLVASLVLRCDDCVKYHIEQCYALNISEKELFEVFSVAMTVSGTILIPHIRRAIEFWDELKKGKTNSE